MTSATGSPGRWARDLVDLPAQHWTAELAQAAAAGFDILDFLTAIDDGPTLRVVCRLRRSTDAAAVLLVTFVPADDPRLASATTTYPGAAWHERETREMFGISFTGLGDDRPLLLRSGPGTGPPLRRSEHLTARLEQPWPGAADPEVGADGRRIGNPSRRRQRPLGVPDDRRPG